MNKLIEARRLKHTQLSKRATRVICEILQGEAPIGILRVLGCGRHTLDEIEQMMHDNGFWLGDGGLTQAYPSRKGWGGCAIKRNRITHE